MDNSVDTLVVYYTETGNTKKLAYSIAKEIPGRVDIFNLSGFYNYQSIKEYNLIILGMPVHGDGIPDKMKDFFKQINFYELKIALFLTHTASIDDESPKKCFSKLVKIIQEKNGVIIDNWSCTCENKNKKAVAWVKEKIPDKYDNITKAIGHPDDMDIINAINWGKNIIKKMNKG